ncbi:DUF4245 domain-containing protein [Rhodococcus sp. HNM0569]|uniref:DUF4245 family protein n=1 Tax=Rhodococcus sp. HNM0569 TaxID=2716340 RepID=UPI00146E72AB|nr:DUF4245 domain-containing protein [Rhodococcus sp. HNM0569]
MASSKPRILNSNRDMLWSLIPLALFAVIIAGIASQCTFSPGGPTTGPIPSFDVDAALDYDAQTLPFPVRNPEIPEGWTPNSGSRSIVTGNDGGDATTVGYIDTAGRYLQLTQSNAAEDELVRFVAGEPRSATGTENAGGQTWIVYGGADVEPIWISDFGDVRVLLTGAGDDDAFRTLADAVAAAEVPAP